MNDHIIYRATVLAKGCKYAKFFRMIYDAERWLDSENNNCENTTMIEVFENGRKTDSFFYTTAR